MGSMSGFILFLMPNADLNMIRSPHSPSSPFRITKAYVQVRLTKMVKIMISIVVIWLSAHPMSFIHSAMLQFNGHNIVDTPEPPGGPTCGIPWRIVPEPHQELYCGLWVPTLTGERFASPWALNPSFWWVSSDGTLCPFPQCLLTPHLENSSDATVRWCVIYIWNF